MEGDRPTIGDAVVRLIATDAGRGTAFFRRLHRDRPAVCREVDDVTEQIAASGIEAFRYFAWANCEPARRYTWIAPDIEAGPCRCDLQPRLRHGRSLQGRTQGHRRPHEGAGHPPGL